MPVPAHNWQFERGSIFRTDFPFNLVENGSLRASIANWKSFASMGAASMSYVSACPAGVFGCLSYISGTGLSNLVISPNFQLVGGRQYVVAISLFAPAGQRVNALVRNGGPSRFHVLGLNTPVTTTGAWQTVSLTFTATASSGNARFDLFVPSASTRVYLRDVSVRPVLGTPTHLIATDRTLQPAHHPNWGASGSSGGSIYLRNSGDSDRVATSIGVGSSYLTTGPDLALPAGASLSADLTAHMRTSAWTLDRRRVISVQGTRLNLDAPTTYPLGNQWGYFLTGAGWMLDSPDEWHHDTANGFLRVWMPDGSNPGRQVAVGDLATGIDLNGRRHVTVDGIAVRGTSEGVLMLGAAAVVLKNVSISNTALEGVDIRRASACRIRDSEFFRTGLDAVLGRDDAGNEGTDNSVSGSRVVDSAVQMIGGVNVSLPAPARAAINPGFGSVISGNTIVGAGYIGARVYGAGVVTGNSIREACVTLTDCGAVHINMTANGTTIAGNLIDSVRGNVDGVPNMTPHSIGIYLDDLSTQITVTDNVVTGADYGIQVHNAFGNLIRGNTLFGNRRTQLWLQEQTAKSRAGGDIYQNQVTANVFFPTTGSPSVSQESYVGDVADFAAFSDNIYSALLSPRVVTEQWPGGTAGYTFAEWQAARAAGLARNNDAAGRAVTPLGYAAFRVLGGNMVPNGSTAQGATGWTSWNLTAPRTQVVAENCAGVGSCLRFVAGGSESLFSTPNFSVVKDQWYRVNFDARTGEAGQGISVLARRGGGGTAGYDMLQSAVESYTGSTQWSRYSYVFKALITVTAGDPVTKELGARIDFIKVPASKTLSVANVEVVPLSPVEVGLRTLMIVNPSTSASSSTDCPERLAQPSVCAQYVRFLDGAAVSWPYTLPPLGRELMFTRDSSLLDTDSDGIADSQDRCAGSNQALDVNALGCAINQVPQ